MQDDNGYTILHLLSAFQLNDILAEFVEKVEVATFINAVGKYDGISALHLAAMYNNETAVKTLLACGALKSIKTHIDGSLPIHIAAHYKADRAFRLLVLDEEDLKVLDNYQRTPVSILHLDGWSIDSEFFIRPDISSQPKKQTGIVSSKWCTKHHTIAPSELHTSNAPPENLWRLHVLIHEQDGILFSSNLRENLKYNLKANSAPLCDVLKVHEWSYVRRIQAACEKLSEDPESSDGMSHLDGDTAISKNSYLAALAAAGAVCTAVDGVMNGELQNAFCPVRPPGHHVGARGAVKGNTGSDSHGFCLLNNVSVGAAYAMTQYRRQVKRVVIVDFDVHHGNGTEATVRNLRPSVENMSVDDLGIFGSIYVPNYKPWRDSDDPENVLFVSVHGYGPPQRGLEHLFPRAAFYPGTGPTSLPTLNAADVRPESADSESASDERQGLDDDQNARSIRFDGDNDMANDPELENVGEEDDDSEEDDSDFAFDSADENGEMQMHEVQDEVHGPIGATVQKLFSMFDHSNPASRVASRAPSPLILDIGVPLPSDQDQNTPLGDTAYGKLLSDFQYRHQWRNYFREHIFPRIDHFKPDLIMISAGFDAHRKDTINAGYIALGEDDFVWVTERLLQLAESHCSGRVVSVLEGGYQINGEYSSAFAKSVAAHVEALSHSTVSRRKFSEQSRNLEQIAEEKVPFLTRCQVGILN